MGNIILYHQRLRREPKRAASIEDTNTDQEVKISFFDFRSATFLHPAVDLALYSGGANKPMFSTVIEKWNSINFASFLSLEKSEKATPGNFTRRFFALTSWKFWKRSRDCQFVLLPYNNRAGNGDDSTWTLSICACTIHAFKNRR